jgi:hypothetical protein
MNSLKLASNLLIKKANIFLYSTNYFLNKNYSILSSTITTTTRINNNKILRQSLEEKSILFEVIRRNYAKKSKSNIYFKIILIQISQFFCIEDDKSSVKKPKVELNKAELNQIINFTELVSDMNQVVEHLKEEYAKNLSLRLNTSIKKT